MNLLPDILTDKQYKKLNENGLFNPINVRNHAMCVRYKFLIEQCPRMSSISCVEVVRGCYAWANPINLDTARRIIVANRKLYDIKKPKQERKKK